MDLRIVKLLCIMAFQFLVYHLLLTLSDIYVVYFIERNRDTYKFYCLTNARLITFKAISPEGCSNRTDLSCSLQMCINVHSFSIKLVEVYLSSILIAMIYTYHQTVRLWSCCFALFVIIITSFGTDFVLLSDKILSISFTLCIALNIILMFATACMPSIIQDPLSFLCGPDDLSIDRYEFLQHDTSIQVRFYRWIQKMKKQWNIEEEKLIVTTIVGIVTSSIWITYAVYVSP
ncbi:unnamed protein product [Rotaria sp. Silwood2]|nr:unnamed protein product [Rotaria sp. Silwood2]CAF4444692.1 unnamed protein product [Rotaria sp. Silwood2]